MTQNLKYVFKAHFWICFLSFQQSWNCNPLGPKSVLFTGDFYLVPGWLPRQETACGICRLLAPSAGLAKEGRGRTQSSFSHLDLSLFASQNGEETDCYRLWRDEFGKSQGSACCCLRKIPRWHLQWKQYVGMWLTQIKFCASHMDSTGVMNTSENIISLPKRLFLAKKEMECNSFWNIARVICCKEKRLKTWL